MDPNPVDLPADDTPSFPAAIETLQTYREKLLRRLLIPVLILGAGAVLPALPRFQQADAPPFFASAYAAAFLILLLSAALRNRLPYLPRTLGMLLALYVYGATSLIQFGATGTGMLWLMALCVLATVLLSVRAGLAGLAVSLASLLGAGWFLTDGSAPGAGAVLEQPAIVWLVTAALFTIIGFLLVLALGNLQSQLDSSLQKERRMVSQMREQQGLLEHRIELATRDMHRRAVQLETTAQIAKLTAEGLDPQDLMARAVESVRDGFGLYHASVFLVDESGTWALLAASTGEAGRRLMASRHRLSVGSASVIGWTTAHRQSRVSSDVTQDPIHYENPFLPQTKSEMAVPLLIGTKLIGALDIHSTKPDAFGPEDIQAFEAIAGELAVAIESARMIAERASQAEEIERDHRSRIRESWEKLTRTGDPLVFQLGVQKGNEDFQATDVAIRSGETAVLPIRGEVAVPIRIRGEVVATIAVRKPGDREPWTDEDIALLEAVAGQAGLALETARQYTEEQRRVAELEVINRVSQAASQMLQPETLFHILHSQINQVLDDVDLAVAVYDQDADELRYPYATRHGTSVELPRMALGDTAQSLVVRSQQPLLLVRNAADEARRLGAVIEGTFARSWLGVPMLAGEEVIGLIIVQDLDHEERFSEDDAALLSTIAGQVATALQNLRLLQQVQRAARRERLIHEITSKVRRSTDIRGILETTAREVGRALNATKATVRLAESDEGSSGSPESGPEGNGQTE